MSTLDPSQWDGQNPYDLFPEVGEFDNKTEASKTRINLKETREELKRRGINTSALHAKLRDLLKKFETK